MRRRPQSAAISAVVLSLLALLPACGLFGPGEPPVVKIQLTGDEALNQNSRGDSASLAVVILQMKQPGQLGNVKPLDLMDEPAKALQRAGITDFTVLNGDVGVVPGQSNLAIDPITLRDRKQYPYLVVAGCFLKRLDSKWYEAIAVGDLGDVAVYDDLKKRYVLGVRFRDYRISQIGSRSSGGEGAASEPGESDSDEAGVEASGPEEAGAGGTDGV